MTDRRLAWTSLIVLLCSGVALACPAADDTLPDSDVLMRALGDEIARSMNLQMEDLEKPYFIQYTVEDSVSYQLTATYGAITGKARDRSRDFHGQVRVGSYELDNTNFSSGGGFFGGRGGGGSRASLPIVDDYLAIRQAIWWATDQDYKNAVETLTKKRAHMKDKNLEDRPNDFSKAPVVEQTEPGAVLSFDHALWVENLKKLSGHFKSYPQIQDSQVQLLVAAGNTYVVNSEGTRVRSADVGTLLIINAEMQAEDGMKMTDSLSYVGDTTEDYPAIDTIIADIDKMVAELSKATASPILERYSGPVLFDGRAACQMFKTLVAGGVAGQVDPVGTQRRMFEGTKNLEKKIGQRILPKKFSIYDDPTVKEFKGKPLMGHFRYDDEGVPAEKVDIVEGGKLEAMVMSRVPTKVQSGSNGHGRRSSGAGSIEAAIGCLFIQDEDGVSDEELKAGLIEAARDEGLEYGLRVAALRDAGLGSSRSDIFSFIMRMQRGGGEPGLGDPVLAYKVYVEDGHEELIRGVEFGQVQINALKDIIAASKDQTVHNYVAFGFSGATPPSSIIAPAVVFEELDLAKIEQEQEKLPILEAPLVRGAS